MQVAFFHLASRFASALADEESRVQRYEQRATADTMRMVCVQSVDVHLLCTLWVGEGVMRVLVCRICGQGKWMKRAAL